MVLFGVFYLPSLIYWLSSEEIAMGMINTGVMEDSIHLKGWVFRDEYVVKTEMAGEYIPLVGDGERVQAFTEVAKILDPSKRDLLIQLENINQDLLRNIQRLSTETGFVFAEIQRVQAGISVGVEDLILALNQQKLFELADYKRQIENQIDKKFRIIYEGEDYGDEKVVQLKRLGENIHQQIDQYSSKIRIPTTGMVSYTLDGYEDYFTKERLAEITLDDLIGIDNTPSYVVSGYRRIETGEPILKIVRDNSYTILARLKSENARLFQEGSQVNLRIEEINRNVSAVVTALNRDKGGDYFIQFTLDQALPQIAKYRKVNINIIRNVHRGLKIPLYALDSFDKERNYGRIMGVKGGVTQYIDVEIEIYDEDFAIIKSISQDPRGRVKLFDYFILNHDKVREGKFVK
jgi:putative membrane fusion protein